MSGIALSWVISMFLSLLASWDGTFNWGDFLTKVLAKVNGVVPPWAQKVVDKLVAQAVAVLQIALGDAADLKAIADDVQAGNWNQALADLQKLIAGVTHPLAAKLAWACGHCGLDAELQKPAAPAPAPEAPPAAPAADGEGKGAAEA